MRPSKVRRHVREEPGRLRFAAHNLGEPMAVRPRVASVRLVSSRQAGSLSYGNAATIARWKILEYGERR
jgi:hypothetical protein